MSIDMEISVKELVNRFGFEVIAGEGGLDNTIKNVYVCDLLSWVIGKAPDSCAWITIQSHVNVVAVALLTGASCVIIAEGSGIEKEAIDKANNEDIPVLSTKQSAYDTARIFYGLETN